METKPRFAKMDSKIRLVSRVCVAWFLIRSQTALPLELFYFVYYSIIINILNLTRICSGHQTGHFVTGMDNMKNVEETT